MLTADEGLAILGAALESRHRVNAHADCSHLVQAIYQRAGFPYAYSPSSELYAGVNEFRRVSRPQPGDLVVWRGHVGIVINPTQHSFFSALRSGLGVEHYDSRYWRGRGHPRFLRYTKNSNPTVLATTQAASLKTSETVEEDDSALDDGEFALPALDTAPPLTAATENGYQTITAPGKVAIPYVQVIRSERPRGDQVKGALLAAFSTTGQSLDGADLFKLPQSVIVFDKFDVKKIHLNGDQGWADVSISEPSTLAGGQANLKKHSERQRLSLTRRDNQTWEITLPPDAVYIPREVAVRILAHQLASLTDTTEPSTAENKKIVLARLLNLLLEQPTPGGAR
jgi:NlpC/P60 family